MSGQRITIEGISGVGKTYYFNKLKKICDKNRIIFNSEINDSKQQGYNRKIFEILTSTNNPFFDTGNPKMETLLIAAKQANDEERFINKKIENGMTVISDRGYDTVCILEGIMYSLKYKTKMEKDIDDLYVFLAKYCRIPDKTILLVDDYNKCIFRVEQRNKMLYNRKEKYILKKSYDIFKKMSVKYSNRIYTININNLSEEEVLNKIMNIINK